MNLYRVAPGSRPWGNICKCHLPGGAFNEATEEAIRVPVLIQRLGEPGSIQPEGTDTIKVCLCVPAGLPVRREVGQGPDKETGVGIKSKEKKKPCRGIK